MNRRQRRNVAEGGRSTIVLDFDFSDGLSAENASFALLNNFGDDIDLNFKGSGRKDFQVSLDATRWAIAKLIIKFLVKGPYNVAKYTLKKVLFGGRGKTETIIREVTIGDCAFNVMSETLREDPDLFEGTGGPKLTPEQIAEIKPEVVQNGVPVRFMYKGGSLNIERGEYTDRGVNVMYQTVYWNFTKETAQKIAKWLGVKAVFDKS